MSQHDDLFDLIRALTPSEKRYFKVHAEKFGNGGYKMQYEKLFDAFNTWPGDSYDEKEFKKKHKGKSFLKNLPSDKNYLRELILKVIRNYSSDADPEAELPEMLLSIRLLISKGLKTQVNKLIEKAMRLAEEREQYTEMLAITDLLLKFYRMSPAEAPYDAWQLEQMDKDILDRITLTRQALYLRTHIIEIQTKAQWKTREKEAREIMGVAIAMTERPNLPRRAELSLLNVRQVYLIHYHRYQECLDITADWLKKIENAPRSFDYSADQYRVTLANYLLCALRNDNLDLFPDAIQKVKAIKTKSEKEAADCFRISAQYEMTYVINKGLFDNAHKMVHEIEDGLKKYSRFIPLPDLVNFRFNIALFFFLQKKYTEALQHINDLYYLSGRDESFGYSTALARCMEWMCQYSLGEFAVLDSSLRNLKRYFSDRNIKHEFFDNMFELFNRILKEAGTKPTSLVAFKKLLSAITPAPEWEQLKGIVLAWL